jgi:hypothetical protein
MNYAKRIAGEVVVDWNPKFTLRHKQKITFNGEQFTEWVAKYFPRVKQLPHFEDAGGLPIGDHMRIGRRGLPLHEDCYPHMFSNKTEKRRAVLSVFQGARKGTVAFDRPVDIPILCKHGNPPEVWMSITPMEVITCRSGLRKAKGDVFIAGLGLGMLARQVREKRGVGKVTVVENNRDLIKFFGKVDGIDVVHGDAYVLGYQDTAHDSILFDIWESYGTAGYDAKWQLVKDKHPEQNLWGWGDVQTLPAEAYW